MMKKIVALTLCVCIAATMLVGCAGNANANANASSTATSEVSTVSPLDGEIVVASASLGSTLNPLDQTDGTTSAFQYGAYDRLVQYGTTTNEDGELVADTENLQGAIAESWYVSEDQLTWTFHIDSRATFANGDKVTAQDVV